MLSKHPFCPAVCDWVHLPIAGDKLKKPELQERVPIVIDGLVIQLQPNVDKFEDELCELIREDRLLREINVQDSLHAVVLERRLQVCFSAWLL